MGCSLAVESEFHRRERFIAITPHSFAKVQRSRLWRTYSPDERPITSKAGRQLVIRELTIRSEAPQEK